jgi:hypothetical protein
LSFASTLSRKLVLTTDIRTAQSSVYSPLLLVVSQGWLYMLLLGLRKDKQAVY